jgi:hypothetical protein
LIGLAPFVQRQLLFNPIEIGPQIAPQSLRQCRYT